MKKTIVPIAVLLLMGLGLGTALAQFRIDMKGGGTYWSNAKPVLKGNAYTFTSIQGQFLSLKANDVAKIEQAQPKKPEPVLTDKAMAGTLWDTRQAGGATVTSTGGGGSSRPRLGRTAPAPATANDLPNSYAYSTGTAYAAPSAADQMQVGRSFAPPASGQVLTGPAPVMSPPW
jgi:hypothetical protein